MGKRKKKKWTTGVLYREVGTDNGHTEILNRGDEECTIKATAFDWDELDNPIIINEEEITISPGTREVFDFDMTRHAELVLEIEDKCRCEDVIANLYFRDRDNCTVGTPFYNNDFVEIHCGCY
ncbi:hypothetical protein [Bacillus solimangrovi]|uniref:Uncharacterized protein n=1 Tax=Bacillus solimangrovi TaxID=1305675 RepID=A0A1E5LI44_9BACI|nr:hypothetical protein [Bacillus solimangrovi]OEH93759.1 hypothetical protein BFG57_11275 [Bacillus solimangrovi]